MVIPQWNILLLKLNFYFILGGNPYIRFLWFEQILFQKIINYWNCSMYLKSFSHEIFFLSYGFWHILTDAFLLCDLKCFWAWNLCIRKVRRIIKSKKLHHLSKQHCIFQINLSVGILYYFCSWNECAIIYVWMKIKTIYIFLNKFKSSW